MPSRARRSRATSSIAATLPPWLVTRTSLRSPARARLSPISVQARDRGRGRQRQRARDKPRCSARLPTRCTGRNVTGRRVGQDLARRAPDRPRRCKLSTPSGKCGPCCSTAASGSTAIQRRSASPAAAMSCQVISIQSRFGQRHEALSGLSPSVPGSPIVAVPMRRSNRCRAQACRCDSARRMAALVRRPDDPSVRSGAGQGLVRHQLGGRGRARRLLPGAGRRHLQEVRPRRHHRAGRAERQQPHPAAGRQDRLLS